jgi:hypothetical protein
MPAVLTLAVLAAQCVTARWFSADPKSLDLLIGTPVNCLIVDRTHWTPDLVNEGHRRGFKMLAETGAVSAGADALVASGPSAASDSLPTILLEPRERVSSGTGLVAVAQGVWPGLRTGDDVVATPSAAPWVDTNLGYLRYLRSQVQETIWMANRPPPGQVFPVRRYEQVMGDTALAGALWVIDIDDTMGKRLLAGDPGARKDWTELMRLAAFLHALPDLRRLDPYSTLGVSVRPGTGALVSGGVLDMIGAQHIPFQVVKSGKGMEQFFDFADDAIVRFPKSSLGRTLVRPEDVGTLEPVYRRVEAIVGRTNFGVRVFNGAGILSAPYSLPGGKGVAILLINYTSYPAENITLHVQGVWKKATLESPGQVPKALSLYSVKTATAIEIDSLDLAGFVRVE